MRRAANDYMTRNVATPKLYEALDYLERTLDKAWLVKRYRNELRGDCRDWRDRKEKQERLLVTARGIQLACVARLVKQINDLALSYRENKIKIDRLRSTLALILKTPRA